MRNIKSILFLILFLIISQFIALSQHIVDLPYNGRGWVEFSGEIEVECFSKQDLFINAKRWFAEEFIEVNEALVVKDEEAGRLIGVGMINYISSLSSDRIQINDYIMFTVLLIVKEGRCRYYFTKFIHEGAENNFGLISIKEMCFDNQKTGIKVCNDIELQITCKVSDLIITLEENMSRPPSSQVKWGTLKKGSR